VVDERIDVIISDTELQGLLSQLEKAKLTGGGANDPNQRVKELNAEINKARQAAREAGINLDSIPALNRDVRMLIKRMPFAREALTPYFQLRRGIRAGQLGREAAGLTAEGIAPELAKHLSIQSMVGYAAIIIFIVNAVKQIANAIKGEIEKIEREQTAYEDMVRKNFDLTYRQFRELSSEQIGYATWWDQFLAQIESKGWLDGAVDYIVDKLNSQGVLLSPEEKALLSEMIGKGDVQSAEINP